jgi:hypothetical protein
MLISPVPGSRPPSPDAAKSPAFNETLTARTASRTQRGSLEKASHDKMMRSTNDKWNEFTKDITELREHMSSVKPGFKKDIDDLRYKNMQVLRAPETGKQALTMQSHYDWNHMIKSGLYVDQDIVYSKANQLPGQPIPILTKQKTRQTWRCRILTPISGSLGCPVNLWVMALTNS